MLGGAPNGNGKAHEDGPVAEGDMPNTEKGDPGAQVPDAPF
jgi:hypothetical protein